MTQGNHVEPLLPVQPWMVEIANRAVEANLKDDGSPKWDAAQGFACALMALRLSSLSWRPIETAPKDETSVDLWVVSESFGWRVADAWWSPERQAWFSSDADYGEPGPCLGPTDTPTHWMPLPVPPTLEGPSE